jgi:hypothetical protein
MIQQKLDHWIFDAFRTRLQDVAIFRILLASAILIAGIPHGLWLRHLSTAFYSPSLSFAAFFSAFPSPGIMVALNLAAVVSATALLLGYHTRTASLLTTPLLVVIRSFTYASGKIDHDSLVVLAPLILAGSGWGACYSIDSRRRTVPDDAATGWSLALYALIISLSIGTAGLIKLRAGWMDPSILATYGQTVTNTYSAGRETWLSHQLLQTQSFVLWKPLDWYTVLFECGFLAVSWHRTAFRVMCAVACCFHLGVGLMMDIWFWTNITAYGAFIPWSGLRWPPSFLQRCQQLAERLRTISGGVLAIGPLALGTFSTLYLAAPIVNQPLLPLPKIITVIAAVAGLGFLSHTVPRFLTRPAAASE